MHCIIETVQGNYLVPSQESNTPAWADAEAYIRSSKVKIECDREFTDADPLKGKSLPYSFRHLLLTGHTEPPSGWTWMHENDIEQRAKSDDVRAMIAYMDPRPLAPPGWQPTHHALEHPPKSYADDFTLPQHFAKLTQDKNPHERDAHVVFYENGHYYLIDGVRSKGSATGLIHKFSEEFVERTVADKMINGKNWPSEGYVDTLTFSALADELKSDPAASHMVSLLSAACPDEKAIRAECGRLKQQRPGLPKKLGMSADAIMRQWVIMRNMGTWTHFMLECWLNRIPIPLSFYDELDMHAFRVYIRSINPHWMIYRTEWEIYSEMENLAGSIDGVFIDTRDDSLVLADWKRTKKLSTQTEGFGGSMMKAPFDHIPDAKLPHYC